MTVDQLREFLKDIPGHVVVTRQMYSEMADLPFDGVHYVTAEEKKVIWRDGQYYAAQNGWGHNWHPPGEEPQYVSVVHFDGN